MHKCPRYFQLSRLKPEKDSNIHFAYGGSFGVGFQALLTGKSLEQAIWEAFLAWPSDFDLLEEKPRDKKSFWMVIAMLDKFSKHGSKFFNNGWQVATFEGQPATELGAKILFPDGFYYLMFMDILLVNTVTKEFKVLELKTTKYSDPNEALYGNSWQGILYSIFLDALAAENSIPGYSSYEVLYFVLSSTAMEFFPMPFKKGKLQKARAIKYILQDIQRIKEYEEDGAAGEFPMYGESCFNYSSFRECQYYGRCHMTTPNLLLIPDEEIGSYEPPRVKEQKIHFTLDVSSIVEGQLS